MQSWFNARPAARGQSPFWLNLRKCQEVNPALVPAGVRRATELHPWHGVSGKGFLRTEGVDGSDSYPEAAELAAGAVAGAVAGCELLAGVGELQAAISAGAARLVRGAWDLRLYQKRPRLGLMRDPRCGAVQEQRQELVMKSFDSEVAGKPGNQP